MKRLFVYGTLECPEVVEKLLGTVLSGENAVLEGYARYMLLNRHYPGIVYRPGARVDGVLYNGITPKFLRKLDRYEDDIYERQVVKVVDSCGGCVDAWAYVIPPRFRKELTRIPWSRDEFVKIHLKRFLNVRC